jgi:hypothetical protein
MPIYRLIRSISPASVSTDPSCQSSRLLANMYARLPFVRRLKPAAMFLYEECRRSFLVSSKRSPSIVVSHNKVLTKPHHDAGYYIAVRSSLNTCMPIYVPSKPVRSSLNTCMPIYVPSKPPLHHMHVTYYLDANQCHLSTSFILIHVIMLIRVMYVLSLDKSIRS